MLYKSRMLKQQHNHIIDAEIDIDSMGISDEEYIQIVECAGTLIYELINTNPMIYSQPLFETIIFNETFELLMCQLQPVFCVDELGKCLERAIEEAIHLYHTHVCPRRSYGNTFIRRKPNIVTMTKKINYLKNIPQPDQRTDEWYMFRHKYLTASSIWKAFGTQRAQNELIYGKCCPINLDKYSHVNTESPMHWGQKYEDISIEIYEKKYKTKVSDFGCIPHRNVSFLAASPDGINTDITSDVYGRMLEVKNIVNREINGIPKLEYWIQMQLQMEVCEMNECDFLETRFVEYQDTDEMSAAEHYESDGEFHQSEAGDVKGIIMFFIKDGAPLYEYAPIGMCKEEFQIWEEEIMKTHECITWVKNIYWRLDEISCVLVLRNKMWFNYALPILENLWATIEKERKEGYEHRAPNRKRKKPPTNVVEMTKITECYINTDNLLINDEPATNTGPLYQKQKQDDAKIINIVT